MIAPVRHEVLSVEDAASFLQEIDEEAERREKEKETNKKNKDEVSSRLGDFGGYLTPALKANSLCLDRKLKYAFSSS